MRIERWTVNDVMDGASINVVKYVHVHVQK